MVAVSKRVLPGDASAWIFLTHIDFIVSSPNFADSIKASGTSQESDDITSGYNIDLDVHPYIAESVPFTFFIRNAANSQRIKRDSVTDSIDEIEEYFIKITLGSGSCHNVSVSNCKNGKLRSNYEYLYVLIK